METVEFVALKDGINIPTIGFGTWQIAPENAERSVASALKVGYRLIDTAIAYDNEIGVGEAINKSGLERGEVFLTSKIPAEIKTYEGAKKAIEESLKRLNTPYIDLMLIHAPRPWSLMFLPFLHYKKGNREVWRALEEAKNEGKIKAIGVSNFSVKDLKLLEKTAKIKPYVNQIRFHVGHTQKKIAEYCKKEGIQLEGYSPLGTGRLLKRKDIQAIASKLGVTLPQLCLKYVVQKGVIPLPKSTHEEYMKANLQLGFVIPKEDMDTLDSKHVL